MSLKVFVADESPTVKKLLELALEDLQPEIKSASGPHDLVAKIQAFGPDIVFLDVLLGRPNGYEICYQLKQNPETAHIPVILLGNPFMTWDENQIQRCQPQARVEKPFELNQLRQLIFEWVPHLRQHPLGPFLKVKRPAIMEDSEILSTPSQSLNSPSSPPNPDPVTSPAEDPFEDIQWDAFESVPITQAPQTMDNPAAPPKLWEPQTSEPNNSNPSPLTGHFFDEVWDAPVLTLNGQSIPIRDLARPQASPSSPSQTAGDKVAAKPSLNLDPQTLETLIKPQIQQIIREIVWQVLPDMLEKILQKEVEKALNELENAVQLSQNHPG